MRETRRARGRTTGDGEEEEEGNEMEWDREKERATTTARERQGGRGRDRREAKREGRVSSQGEAEKGGRVRRTGRLREMMAVVQQDWKIKRGRQNYLLCGRPFPRKKESLAGLTRPCAAAHGPLPLGKVLMRKESADAPGKSPKHEARA